MNKKYIFLFSLILLLLLIKCNEEDEINDLNYLLEEGYDENYDDDEYGFFKESLQEYLISNNLFKSEKLIEPNEMRRIFLEVISEGSLENTPSYLRNIFEQLAEHFTESYYSEKKQIRGKDIYNLIDINEINIKFEEFAEKSPLFGYGEEEDNNFIGNDL